MRRPIPGRLPFGRQPDQGVSQGPTQSDVGPTMPDPSLSLCLMLIRQGPLDLLEEPLARLAVLPLPARCKVSRLGQAQLGVCGWQGRYRHTFQFQQARSEQIPARPRRTTCRHGVARKRDTAIGATLFAWLWPAHCFFRRRFECTRAVFPDYDSTVTCFVPDCRTCSTHYGRSTAKGEPKPSNGCTQPPRHRLVQSPTLARRTQRHRGGRSYFSGRSLVQGASPTRLIEWWYSYLSRSVTSQSASDMAAGLWSGRMWRTHSACGSLPGGFSQTR